jgi:hypothetical protein
MVVTSLLKCMSAAALMSAALACPALAQNYADELTPTPVIEPAGGRYILMVLDQPDRDLVHGRTKVNMLVDTKTGAPGTFLSYSTSPGAEAEDGNGANSPYTTALLQAAREPGLPIEQAFKRVRVAVNKVTEGRQTPWDSSSLTEDFRFVVWTDASAANAGPRPVVAKRSVDEWKRSLQGKPIEVANETIVGDGSLEAYEAFVALYTAPPYGPQAREWLDLHNRMAAWNEAVLINTVVAYQGFLDRYPNSDLTSTARKLIERLRNRPIVTPVVAAANAAIPAAPPATPPVVTANAVGPTCPCSQTPARRSETPKRVEQKPTRDEPPKRASRTPRRDPGDDVVVYAPAPPPREYYGPPVRVVPPVNLGIGIGGGYGGGYGRPPMNYPTRRGY